MSERYEAPEIAQLGTVRELTQANLFGESPDNLTWILPILGEDAFS
jgi:hypothetical protein